MKRRVIGLLANVDAGKTTLSECLLYMTGQIRSKGRVDHRNTFLDTDDIERERGITVFSKCASFEYGDTLFTLIDTPGHIDLSSEMERTLSILDAAVLILSAPDGVDPYSKRLFKMLAPLEIPVFIFVNKMDMALMYKKDILKLIKQNLSENCICFDDTKDEMYEELSLCDEEIMECFLEKGTVPPEDISYLIVSRKAFPVYFGSGLKGKGVDAMLKGLAEYSLAQNYYDAFAALVYKIDYSGGAKMTFMRMLGGELKCRDSVFYEDGSSEKVTQIRIYQGNRFKTVESVSAGEVCAVLGLTKTSAGMGLGKALPVKKTENVSVVEYKIICDDDKKDDVFRALFLLCEEDPSLGVRSDRPGGDIYACLMGEVHIQIVKRLVKERFGFDIDLELSDVIYKETVRKSSIGIGHFEPLRHYAEVHLLIEPAKRGEGIHYFSKCSTDVLALPYQKQILNALMQDDPIGVLTGAGLTDVNVTLVAGKAHEKHTEGGDLRQAAKRALRQGLLKTENILLEPYENFVIKVPAAVMGRLMTDLSALGAEFAGPELSGDISELSGKGPVRLLNGYKSLLRSYAGGDYSWESEFCGFLECTDAEEIISKKGYDPLKDNEHSADSVFCSHGSGEIVSWKEVDARAHVSKGSYEAGKPLAASGAVRTQRKNDDDDDLEKIFERTYGKIKRERYPIRESKTISNAPVSDKVYKKPGPKKENILIIDGYNVIYDWKELRELADDNIDSARDALIDRMINYKGFTGKDLMIVFDAYRTPNPHSIEEFKDGLRIVYTARNESADLFIERFAHSSAKDKALTVVTSDGLEQLHVFAQGAVRMSSNEFHEEIIRTEEIIRERLEKR
jgi:small GTP-binding protein